MAYGCGKVQAVKMFYIKFHKIINPTNPQRDPNKQAGNIYYQHV